MPVDVPDTSKVNDVEKKEEEVKEEDTEEAIMKRLEGYVEIIDNNSEEAKAIQSLLCTQNPDCVHLPPSISKEQLREDLLRLQKEKEALLARLGDAMSFLQTTPAGMTSPLIDKDGFPRNDCDLYAVRAARQTVFCTRNSLATNDAQLGQKLELLHILTRKEGMAQLAEEEEQKAASNAGRQNAKGNEKEVERRRLKELCEEEKARASRLKPFLYITQVAPGSPAADAGLSSGMEVVEFGDLNNDNFKSRNGIADLMEVVERTSMRHGTLSVWARPDSRNRLLPVEEEVKQYLVAPMSWEGKGKLGCRFEVSTSL